MWVLVKVQGIRLVASEAKDIVLFSQSGCQHLRMVSEIKGWRRKRLMWNILKGGGLMILEALL